MRYADCHPDKRRVARGLCRECYQRAYLSNPINREKKNKYYSSSEWVNYRKEFYESPEQREKQHQRWEIKRGRAAPLAARTNNYADAEIEDYRVKMSDKTFRDKPENKNPRKEYNKQWRSTSKGKTIMRDLVAAYRAAKLKRTVSWSNKDAIREIYANRPKGMAVDHIIPLQGDHVSGLHVPENLQYLTKEENSSKNNSFDFTLTNEGWRNRLTDEYKSGSINDGSTTETGEHSE